MEEKGRGGNLWIYLFIGIGILALIGFIRLQRENERLKEENQTLLYEVNDYESALEEANAIIEEANSVIEDAQSYAWSSYEEMGEALKNLYTFDTVSNP